MWILDSCYRKGGVELWSRGPQAAMAREEYDPPFCLHLPDPAAYWEMIDALSSQYPVEECRFRTIYGELDGYSIRAGRAVAEAIEKQTRFSAQLYNVDVRRDQRFMAERGIFPCGEPHESRFSPDPAIMLETVGVRIPESPATAWEITRIDFTHEREEHLQGPEKTVLADFFSLVAACDPDVILFPFGDTWLSRIRRKARDCGLEMTISRSGRYRQLDSQSYWSYGIIRHRDAALIPDGRILIDPETSFVYREGGLQGVLISARLSGLPPNLVARFTPGTLISSYEVFEAIRLGIAVPFRKGDAELLRRAPDLKSRDKGGMMFQPEPGIYENVHEIDFTSLYPSIIVKYNLSPETFGHPGRPGFLAQVLAPLLSMRIRTKQLKKTEPRYAGTDSVLKWLLVVCFGYTGYRNAKFGRIETHEAITAHSREILIRTKDIAEGMGFRLIHGIVDCLWVQGGPVPEMKRRVEEETGLPTEVGTYDWIVFLPLLHDSGGAYNRYFGRLPDGSVKVRGVAARRHDTPEYVRRMQEEMLRLMSRAVTVQEIAALEPQVKEVYRQAVTGLHAAKAEDLLIRRRISRLAYAHRCLEAAAVYEYRRCGLEIAPGMQIAYVVRDAARYFVDTEWSATTADTQYYRTLLDRAWEEIAYSFGRAVPERDCAGQSSLPVRRGVSDPVHSGE
jgi:DNA polymerase I